MENTLRENPVISNYEPIDLSYCDGIKSSGTIKEYYYHTGTIDSTFLHIYNNEYQKINQNSPVLFNNHNSIHGNCYHEPRTSQIFVWKTGFYHIYTTIYHQECCQYSLFKNSTDLIPGSIIGNNSVNSIIIPITYDDFIMDCSYSPCGSACSIELVNITPTLEYITLYDMSGSSDTFPRINSSITLISICN